MSLAHESVAHELRAAAQKMRELAEAAPQGGWDCLDNGDRLITWSHDPGSDAFEYLVDEPVGKGFGEHAAHWDPDTAAAVAGLLAAVENEMDVDWRRFETGDIPYTWTAALAVARAFMGGEQQ